MKSDVENVIHMTRVSDPDSVGYGVFACFGSGSVCQTSVIRMRIRFSYFSGYESGCSLDPRTKKSAERALKVIY